MMLSATETSTSVVLQGIAQLKYGRGGGNCSSAEHKHTATLLKDTEWGTKKATFSTTVDDFYILFEAFAQVLRRCRFPGSPDYSTLHFITGEFQDDVYTDEVWLRVAERCQR